MKASSGFARICRPGISLDKSAQVAGHIRTHCRTYPEVQLVCSQTGRNDSGTDPTARIATSSSWP